MNQDQQQKMFEYIDALEKTNKQLVTPLKLCVELLMDLRLFCRVMVQQVQL